MQSSQYKIIKFVWENSWGFLLFVVCFFPPFKYHAFNWNNTKNGDDMKIFTHNCIPVESINNPAQFHTSVTRDLIKSCASKQCIPPKHLSLLVTCKTLAEVSKTQMTAGRKAHKIGKALSRLLISFKKQTHTTTKKFRTAPKISLLYVFMYCNFDSQECLTRNNIKM